ncbi:MAG: hypothetical protein ACFE7R_07245 [Candidatus Hodarchaeota archaeon]
MVRQIALEFTYRKRAGIIDKDDEEIALAMAFLLAESNRKSSAKITALSQVTLPFWIVQVSDSESLILSATGETSVSLRTTEHKSISSVRRILSHETAEVKNIPAAIDEALPLLEDIEQQVHELTNVQNPELFVALSKRFVDVEPGAKFNALEMKVDTQTVLGVSQQYQTLMQDAKLRLKTMEELQKVTQERLTNRLQILDNVFRAESNRWEKRHETQEKSTGMRVENLREQLATKVYHLKDKKKKDEKSLVGEFAREAGSLEDYLNELLSQVQATRQDIATKDLTIEAATNQFEQLLENLQVEISRFTEVRMNMKNLVDKMTQRSAKLEELLAQDIKTEEDATDAQIAELNRSLDDLQKEIENEKAEFNQLRTEITSHVHKMEEAVESRANTLRDELSGIMNLAMSNNAIKGLSPLTQVNINTFVVSFNRGKPLVLAPIMLPEKRMGVPYRHDPLDTDLENFVQMTVESLMKSSASFKTAFEKACIQGNVFSYPENLALFTKGIERLENRNLLKLGTRETLQPMFTTLVGKCPKCNADLGGASKLCPDCGESLA